MKNTLAVKYTENQIDVHTSELHAMVNDPIIECVISKCVRTCPSYEC